MPGRPNAAVCAQRSVRPGHRFAKEKMPHPHDAPPLDLDERGADRDGQPQRSSMRLFMQLTVFECADDLRPPSAAGAIAEAISGTPVGALVYDDVNNPRGLGLLVWTTSPADLVESVRPALLDAAPRGLRVRPEMSMLGRTYSTGFEPNLDYWILKRPAETVMNPAWPWAVWYPLRRKGAFEALDRKTKGEIMREHGGIGRAYGEADLAHDVRLACHGLDSGDNEFVIGLIGKDLYPLSHVVQAMRSTRQTSEFVEKMGPFFVGRVAWRKP